MFPEGIINAAVEAHLDEKGIVWPEELAPFPVELVTLNSTGDLRLDELSRDLYEEFEKSGIDIFWDDRDFSPGVKFNDADLVGFPLRVVVGNRTVERGTVDLQFRKKKETETVPLASVMEAVRNAISSRSR